MDSILCVIPARYKSSRFPGKPLAEIEGKPLIWWVYQNAIKVNEFSSVVVATDDERIKESCNRLKIEVIMTSDKHPTGTDRVAEVAKKVKADLYINVQGDEPLVKPETIKRILPPFRDKSTKIEVVNMMTAIKKQEDLGDPTVPKVVVNLKGEAVFLSRLPIPYPKGQKPQYYKQVCIYGFTPRALSAFKNMERGTSELAEDIELLRFIENRMIVHMIEVEQDTVAVDTPQDLELVRTMIRAKK